MKRSLIINIGIILILIGIPDTANAAKFYLSTKSDPPPFKRDTEVILFLDAEGESINAVEGTISMPAGAVDNITVQDGDSIIDIWIVPPQTENGNIVFSGIIPGGFSGVQKPFQDKKEAGKILSFTVQPQIEGAIPLILENMKALINDGLGTEALVTKTSLSLNVSREGIVRKIDSERDSASPEPFEIIITRDDSFFDGQYVALFSAKDKGSGISYYEVIEKKPFSLFTKNVWNVVTSPFVLQDQKLTSAIYIRAIDNAGNIRTSQYVPISYHYTKFKNSSLWGIVLILILIILIVLTKKLLKKGIT